MSLSVFLCDEMKWGEWIWHCDVSWGYYWPSDVLMRIICSRWYCICYYWDLGLFFISSMSLFNKLTLFSSFLIMWNIVITILMSSSIHSTYLGQFKLTDFFPPHHGSFYMGPLAFWKELLSFVGTRVLNSPRANFAPLLWQSRSDALWNMPCHSECWEQELDLCDLQELFLLILLDGSFSGFR